MKKFFSLLLVFVLLLGLCACKKNEEKKAGFQVGFGRADITPDYKVTLAGYDPRDSVGILDRIYVTCIALTDESGNTALVFTEDSLGNMRADLELAFDAAQKATGVPKENMTLGATHTHSAPRSGNILNYADLVAQAAKDAMDDRAPAVIKAGSIEIPGMNFVRHYTMADGTIQGDNFGNPRRNITGHATEADAELQMLRFVREEKKDVLMVNWQAHPKMASTSTTKEGQATRDLISADFIGSCRTYIEATDPDCQFAYYSGASGNLNHNSYIATEMANCPTEVGQYGQQLGGFIMEGMANLKEIAPGKIRTAIKDQPISMAGSTNDDAVVGIRTIVMGQIAFAAVPYEMFDTNGKYVKDNSPCEFTFVLSCANGRAGYVPADYVWDYNPGNAELIPYEVKSCPYARGTGERVAEALVDMLTELAQ